MNYLDARAKWGRLLAASGLSGNSAQRVTYTLVCSACEGLNAASWDLAIERMEAPGFLDEQAVNFVAETVVP